MKKMVVFLLAITAILFGTSLSAQAALVTITFDEPGIEIGETISTQYSSQGINWSGSNSITVGSAFSNPFPPFDAATPKILQYDTKPTNGVIILSTIADYFSIDFRRPASAGDITLALYNGTDLVHNYGRIGWDGPDWEHYTYNGEYGNFNQIILACGNKFVMDNLEVNMVPIPASLWLLASGLIMLIRTSKRNG